MFYINKSNINPARTPPLGGRGVNSFTIIETIIVMILSSLVLMTAYLAFDILHRQFINYQKNSARVNNIYFFYTTLQHDFNNACVVKNGQNFTLQKETRKITYSFQNSLVTREENGITDTLINNIDEMNLHQDTTICNKVTESLILYLPKDTLTFNFNYYIN